MTPHVKLLDSMEYVIDWKVLIDSGGGRVHPCRLLRQVYSRTLVLGKGNSQVQSQTSSIHLSRPAGKRAGSSQAGNRRW